MEEETLTLEQWLSHPRADGVKAYWLRPGQCRVIIAYHGARGGTHFQAADAPTPVEACAKALNTAQTDPFSGWHNY